MVLLEPVNDKSIRREQTKNTAVEHRLQRSDPDIELLFWQFGLKLAHAADPQRIVGRLQVPHGGRCSYKKIVIGQSITSLTPSPENCTYSKCSITTLQACASFALIKP